MPVQGVAVFLYCIFWSSLSWGQQGITHLATPVVTHGSLQVKGHQLVDQHGKPVVLKGMSFGWHNWWSRFYNAGAVTELVHNWGVTVLRAAMGVEPEKGYLKDPGESVRLVRTVIDACVQEGIYVIIDWHSHNIQEKEAVAFFEQVAKIYGHLPNVIYEIFNEPDKETWPEVKAYSEAVIRGIRKYDPDNIILVGSPHWDQDLHLVAADPIKSFSNLMYSLHFYAATHKQALRNRAADALKAGLPVFVSECAGMEATGDGPIDAGEWEQWMQLLSSWKISWVAWSVADKKETCSVLQPSAASDGGWREADIKEWGRIVRQYLRKSVVKQQ